jgi:hypothetical protein
MGELLNLVGLSAGVVLYAMLLVMVLRAPAASLDGRGDRLPVTTALLGLAWNVCAILIFELPNLGIRSSLPYPSVVGFSALGEHPVSPP